MRAWSVIQQIGQGSAIAGDEFGQLDTVTRMQQSRQFVEKFADQIEPIRFGLFAAIERPAACRVDGLFRDHD
ncbi:hypothetical protein AH2_0004 [Burkholderia phage vB_BceS_AH2]|uniref:Uncharacterized protein n=1 Tax=Burkholderia phage vB_BceS_AH2 TaxID=1133022 RepID=I6NLH4_9CAUD|nr:hypothetical protein B613_gp04 [Burkholderia phage vB_BceS_AH2]AEY69515.1 hypothetical protein AH2_0004 [Burkholderia phage vB_BceS_AH2]